MNVTGCCYSGIGSWEHTLQAPRRSPVSVTESDSEPGARWLLLPSDGSAALEVQAVLSTVECDNVTLSLSVTGSSLHIHFHCSKCAARTQQVWVCVTPDLPSASSDSHCPWLNHCALLKLQLAVPCGNSLPS